MKTAKIAFTLAGLLFAFQFEAMADSIQLRNGRHLNGKYIGGSATLIGFMTSQSVEYFRTSDVTVLTFGEPSEPVFSVPQSNVPDGNAQPSCSLAPGRFIPPISSDSEQTIGRREVRNKVRYTL